MSKRTYVSLNERMSKRTYAKTNINDDEHDEYERYTMNVII
jgi:hypothetical protein